MATTARAILKSVHQILRVVGAGEGVQPDDEADGLLILNRMLGTWNAKNLRLPVGVRSPYTLTAALHTQTIGPAGATLTGARPVAEPTRAVRVDGTLEWPIRILTHKQWEDERDRTTQGTVDRLRYEPTVPAGTLYLFPVPSAATPIALFYQTPALLAFADYTTSYDLRDGYEEAFVYDLARRIAGLHGKSLDPDSKEIWREAMEAVTTRNEAENIPQMEMDSALRDWQYGTDFDITTGEMT